MKLLALWPIITMVILAACQKEAPLIEMRRAVTLDTPLHLQMDTSCLHAPNIITKNWDGINEYFALVWHEQPASFSLKITNPSGKVMMHSTEYAIWSANDPEYESAREPVPYLYDLHLVTDAGTVHQVSKVFYVLRDIEAQCITREVAPLFGDMLDPRRCDIPYETKDMVCVD